MVIDSNILLSHERRMIARPTIRIRGSRSRGSRLWREASAVRAAANIALENAHVLGTVRALAPLRRRVRALVKAGIESGAFRGDMSDRVLAFLVEETARATLRERRLTSKDGASTVVRVVLSIVGVPWTEQVALLEAHPEIVAAG